MDTSRAGATWLKGATCRAYKTSTYDTGLNTPTMAAHFHCNFHWRRTWSHVVDCRSNTQIEEGQMPTLLLMPGLRLVRLFDPVNYRGSVSTGAGEELRSRELFDEILRQSEEAFPATRLGL